VSRVDPVFPLYSVPYSVFPADALQPRKLFDDEGYDADSIVAKYGRLTSF